MNLLPIWQNIQILVFLWRALAESESQAAERQQAVQREVEAAEASHRENQQALDTLIGEWTATFTAEDLLAHLERHGVPAGRIYRAPEMLDDPQFQARESIVEVPHPKFHHLKMQNVAPKLSATAGSIRWPGP